MKELENNFTHWKDLTIKDKIAYSSSVASFSLGWILIFISLFLPPVGDINASIITIFGVALSYSGALLGIGMYLKTSTSELKTDMGVQITQKVNEYLDKKFSSQGHPIGNNEKQSEYFVDGLGNGESNG